MKSLHMLNNNTHNQFHYYNSLLQMIWITEVFKNNKEIIRS